MMQIYCTPFSLENSLNSQLHQAKASANNSTVP